MFRDTTLTVVTAVTLLTACGGTTPTDTVGEVPAELLRLQGNSQFDLPGATLDIPLVVQAVDDRSRPVPGVPITWTASGTGSFEFRTTRTDIAGKAVAWAILGRSVGTYEFRAEIANDSALAARFTVFATADGDPPVGPPPAATVTVSDAGFSPEEVQVRVLDGVKWVWRDATEPHDLVFEDPEAVSPAIGNMAAKREGSFTGVMNREGTLHYACSIHGAEAHAGTVVVTN